MRRLTAEFEPQSGTVIAWPFAGGDWTPFLQRVEPEFVAFAGAILDRQALVVLCRNEEICARVNDWLGGHPRAAGRLRLLSLAYDDTWVRDYGPLSVEDQGQPRLVDFGFDGWAGKYESANDDRASRRMAATGLFGDTPLERVETVLEGGSIESDGSGTLLTTYHCLVGSSRNPDLDQAGLEAVLSRNLGAQRVLWLHHGHLPGDDTDGHIDTLARFCATDTIAYVGCANPADELFEPLGRMREELRALRQADGAAYRLIELPLPAEPLYGADGTRLPAAYANFLIVNGAVLVPVYGDINDELACERLGQAFGDREIVPLSSRAIIEQFGSLHCLSMQIPATVPLNLSPGTEHE